MGLLGGATYDPLVALATVSAVGLAWYTYFTRRGIVDAATRAEMGSYARRTSIATAVLAEMSSLTGRLRNLNRQGSSAAKPEFVNTPALDHACGVPELFADRSVQVLFETRRRIDDVRLYLSEIDKQQGLASAADNYGHSTLAHMTAADLTDGIKIRAAWAFNKAVELVRCMQDEGGLMPRPGEPSVTADDDIPLHADPFDRPTET